MFLYTEVIAIILSVKPTKAKNLIYVCRLFNPSTAD